MIDYRNIIRNRELRLRLINLLAFIPDKPYLKMVYKAKTGKKLNLKNPVGYNEKLNWLKLNDRHPEYTDYVDKIKARKYVADMIGDEYVVPLLGQWKRFEDIDFDALPDQFVLKCNHDSGSAKVIKDKNKCDKAALKKFYSQRLKINSFNMGREYPYKNVDRKIIAEKYVGVNAADGALNDYKYVCMNGEPQFMYIITGKSQGQKIDYFDLNFNHLPIGIKDYKTAEYTVSKPVNFEKMKDLAAKLAKGKKFVRVDFYEVNEKVYFSELTFFDNGGFHLLYPLDWEKQLGDLLQL